MKTFNYCRTIITPTFCHFRARKQQARTQVSNTSLCSALSHGDEKFKRFRRFWRQFPNMAGACVARRDQFACQLTRYGVHTVRPFSVPTRPQDNSFSTDEKTRETARFHFTNGRRRENDAETIMAATRRLVFRHTEHRIPDTMSL